MKKSVSGLGRMISGGRFAGMAGVPPCLSGGRGKARRSPQRTLRVAPGQIVALQRTATASAC